jgi:hypothetical protein
MEEDKNTIDQIFDDLVNKIAAVADELVAQEKIHSNKQIYYYHVVDNLQCNEDGSGSMTVSARFIEKPNWDNSVPIIEKIVKATLEYQRALQVVKDTTVYFEAAYLLETFTRKAIWKYMHIEKISKETYAVDFLSALKKHLAHQKVEYKVRMELLGVEVSSQPIHIDTRIERILLRQFTLTDVRRDIPWYGSINDFGSLPTALLEIDFTDTTPNNAQRIFSQVTTILSLFKVGNVRSKSSEIMTESFMMDRFGLGIYTGRDFSAPQEKYKIGETETEKLKNFWNAIRPNIPDNGYGGLGCKVNHLEIAYQRYQDGLNDRFSIEQRIASTVMGLESLFLTSQENGELSYRLRQRVAKLLGLLGREPSNVRDVTNKAYSVRSAFVHGDVVKNSVKKGIENKYSTFDNLLRLLLDHLRTAIVFFTLAQETKNKEELIRLMDDSYIDIKKNEELVKVCVSFMEF